MNWSKLKYFFMDVLIFLAAHWYIVVPVIAGIIIFLIVGIGIDSCRTRNREEKKDELNTNIKTAEIEANVLTNQKVNINGDIKNANQNSNSALDNFNHSVNRDSNTFSGNAEDKFCERFPADSTCTAWRERQGL